MKIASTSYQRLDLPIANKHKVEVYVKREDLNHPFISGNKLRKLHYNLEEAKKQQHKTLLTFGGAFSNHIYATAAAGKLEGFRTIGLIRGEERLPLNPTLQFAQEQGMALHYVSRAEYRSKNSPVFLEGLKSKFGECYIIPEGGTNALAIQGCAEILADDELHFTHYCLSVGTGGTLGGIIQRLKGKQEIIGFSALKGSFLENEVRHLFKKYDLQANTNWQIENSYHFGGYAKTTPELMHFIHEMEDNFKLPLDPVYTAKTLYGIIDLIEKETFPHGSQILFIHTGGLQGRAGFGL